MAVIDPQQIQTGEQLTEGLQQLFHKGGWSIHRLAEQAGLSTATVQAIVKGSTGIPRTATLKAFVIACGHNPVPWVAARGRAVQATRLAQIPRVVNVPRTEHTFVGRVAELGLLTEALTRTGERAAGGVVIQAVHGLGGIGKSTLAARWARAHAGEHEATWWITADTPAGLDAGLAGLAIALEPETSGRPLKTLVAQATSWLSAHSRWLLILDNVTDPATIAPLLDRASTGRVVVTSRLAEGWHRLGAKVIRLDVLSEEQAIELLGSISAQDRDDANLNGSTDLVRELGCLPLAIEQGAAYLHQTHLSPASYLDLLQKNPAVMFDQTARGADAQRSIARTWRITLDTVADTPLPGQILRITAWWGSEAIPRFLLGPVADPVAVEAALGSLAAYNMITLNTGSVTVHRLVQAVARTPDPADPHRRHTDIHTARSQATDLLTQACPDPFDPGEWPTWRGLLPHIDALASHSDISDDSDNTVVLLDRTATFLQNQGALARAISYFERALVSAQRRRGDDDPLTLDVRNDVALAYRDVGDLQRAIALTERTLADRERVQGPDHRETMTTRRNLASICRDAGDLRRAIELNERTAADYERVLGHDHKDTLATYSNLAVAYGEAGDLSRAIPLAQQCLAQRERVLGHDHWRTLFTRYSLARAYQAAGDLARAIPLFEQTLADSERTLGSDHELTKKARARLITARE
jgi:tetratricopeptide (TPR) repeat protein/transcriptional regulator with XRE-family HTH domain